jgi:Pentapeptide repeats (8 copies)
VANPDHLALLQQGVDVWNAWRVKEPSIAPDLRGGKLSGADLHNVNLGGADLYGANLEEANLREANFGVADLRTSNLDWANLSDAILVGANLSRASLWGATLNGASLSGANLSLANLSGANFIEANLNGADLSGAALVRTNLADAVLTGCSIYGISAWNVNLSEGSKQQDLVITPPDEPPVTVDDLEVAQFVYLLLHNEKIRRVIDTVGKKGVLLLGRFTEGRIAVLERLREELRERGYLPIVFNFDKPETKDFTETVRLLAGLSEFVIADITNPKSAPLELQATVPEIMVPFRPILEEREEPFAMLQDLWIKHREWVFEPLYYSSLDALVGALDEKIIRPAEARFVELLKRKADTMGGEHV